MSLLNKEIFEKNKLTLIVLALFLIFAALLFGLTGVIFVLCLVFIFIIPIYLILKKLDIDEEDRRFFSFFIGVGIVPIPIYYLGILFNSFRIGIIVSIVLFYAVGISLNLFIKKKST